MAKFIAFNSSAAGLDNGELLVSAESVVFVEAGSATTTKLYVQGPAAADLITITHTSTGTTPSMRDAVNYALTANPGGVKAKVQNPSGISISGIAIA